MAGCLALELTKKWGAPSFPQFYRGKGGIPPIPTHSGRFANRVQSV
jgi:hypothetical protein